MIGEIKNEVNQTTILPDATIKAEKGADIFDQGFDVFKSLLDSMNPFENSTESASKETISQLTQDSMTDVADIVVEVSRNVFSEQPVQTVLENLFSSEDVSALQNSLASALTASLMGSLTNIHNASETENSDTSTPSTVTEETSWNVAESLADFPSEQYDVGLDDVFSLINPLDNIPIISDVQQMFGSSEMKAFSSMVGGYFVAGPIGLAYAGANVASEEFTGDSILGNLVELGREVFSSIAD